MRRNRYCFTHVINPVAWKVRDKTWCIWNVQIFAAKLSSLLLSYRNRVNYVHIDLANKSSVRLMSIRRDKLLLEYITHYIALKQSKSDDERSGSTGFDVYPLVNFVLLDKYKFYWIARMHFRPGPSFVVIHRWNIYLIVRNVGNFLASRRYQKSIDHVKTMLTHLIAHIAP